MRTPTHREDDLERHRDSWRRCRELARLRSSLLVVVALLSFAFYLGGVWQAIDAGGPRRVVAQLLGVALAGLVIVWCVERRSWRRIRSRR